MKFNLSVSNISFIQNNLCFIIITLILFSCGNQDQEKQTAELPHNTTSVQKIEAKFKIDFSKFKANSISEMNPSILCIFQDSHLNYWFGTQSSGVYCYNGKTLLRFTDKDGLAQNQVQDIQEDQFGKIWFTCGGFGISYFDGNTFFTLTETSPIKRTKGTEQDWNLGSNDLWFSAGGGAFRYVNETLMYLPFPKPEFDPNYTPKAADDLSAYAVYSVLRDRNGKLWFGTQSNGVCCYDGKTFTWFTDKGLRGPAVLAVFEDAKGVLWFGTNGKGLFRYDGKTLSNVTEEQGLSNYAYSQTGKADQFSLARVWSINEDRNGNLWIGTGDAGLWRFDGKKLSQYATLEKVGGQGIETLYKDKDGELWIGTNGAGVYLFNGGSIRKVDFNKKIKR